MLLSLATTNGLVWPEPQPRDSLACEPVLARFVFCSRTPSLIHLTTLVSLSDRGAPGTLGPQSEGAR